MSLFPVILWTPFSGRSNLSPNWASEGCDLLRGVLLRGGGHCRAGAPRSLSQHPLLSAHAQEWGPHPPGVETTGLPSPIPDTRPSKAALSPTAASGPEDVALYVGLIAVAVCLLLLLLALILVYCRKKEGLDSDVADSSILTSGFQPVSIKPSKAGVGPPAPGTPALARRPRAA